MFSKRLKELRNKKGLTQTEFAKIFGISSGTIAMWETGKRTPDKDMIIKIARYFDVSTDYLLGNDDQPHHDDPPLSGIYLSFADAEANGIDPEDIKLAIETIKRFRNKDK